MAFVVESIELILHLIDQRKMSDAIINAYINVSLPTCIINRKWYHSVDVQGPTMKFNAMAKVYPGSTQYVFIWENSKISFLFESDQLPDLSPD